MGRTCLRHKPCELFTRSQAFLIHGMLVQDQGGLGLPWPDEIKEDTWYACFHMQLRLNGRIVACRTGACCRCRVQLGSGTPSFMYLSDPLRWRAGLDYV